MMQNNITLSDIAEKLGVSSVTVSKALSGKKGVSNELREKIESLADEMGYVRKDKNDVARKIKVIGVIVAERYLDHSQSFYWRIYQKLSLISNEKKIFTLLEVISKTAETEKNVPNLVRQDNVDGIIILGAFDVGYLRMLKEIVDVPLVSLDSVYEEIAGDAVIADNILGGYEIAGYLLGMGHKNIGFVGTMNVTPSIDERYIGMCKQLSASGFSVDFGKNPIVVGDRDADGNIGAEGTFKLPDKKQMPTAFFCNCDVSALLLIERLTGNGYRVPEDVSVIGFDNYAPDMKQGLSLASYKMDIDVMAGKAIELMTMRLHNPKTPFESAMIRGSLIPGESVGKPRSAPN
ncbi:LacI family DNA-binding transcriptional regulator [Butyrivibrio sp. AC2005]|uniref:LacI family DNA-binding transcriptional regulator n=1 Tax=Butyrivibrio sp. AC2005 TaxID=1280672 RepID=UPI000404149B|nr:LacI family DNA-binding transcriptional regulator [Butyrivibrio sp. AC2005]